MTERASRQTLTHPADAGEKQPGGQTIKSAELFARGHEVTIDHHGDLYRLRETSKGRLILTK